MGEKNICVILLISICVVDNNRKARKTQTTSRDNQGIEKGTSEQTKSCILKQMGCSRRPHWVRLLSAKTCTLQFTQAHSKLDRETLNEPV